MSRFDFMRELEGLLQDIPLEERNEALKYYKDYFDDAGVNNEDKTISELGTPERIASIIKADLKAEGSSNQDRGIYTEKGYKDTLYEEKKFEIIRPTAEEEKENKQFNSQDRFNNSYNNNKTNTNSTNNTNIALIIIICILAIPIGIPVIVSVFGIAISLVVALCGILFGFGIAGIVMVPVGIAMIFIGLVKMGIPLWGLSIIGGGLLVLGIGMVFLILSIWIFKIVFPALIRGIVYICRLPFKNRSVSV